MPYADPTPNPFVPDREADLCSECRTPAAEEPLVWHPLCRIPAPLTDLTSRWVYEPGWRCRDREGCLARQNDAW